ncbi:MAG: hypothetical protein JWO57_3276 [Pseudonocardiales bacterium]|nr:hypothetical protein [Pseudonocardiales bacterium]
MSITSDIRSYADTALEQGKQVLDQAQSQLTDVSGQLTGSANELVGKIRGTAKGNVSGLTAKAGGTVGELRTQAEKAVNIEAIKAAVEPYVAQAKGYSTTVTDRAEELFTTVKSDKRVAKIATLAEEFTGSVVETVHERVVKPVQSLTGIGGKPTAPATPARPKPATQPATRPATTATTKPAAKATTKPAARKAPAKKAAPKS